MNCFKNLWWRIWVRIKSWSAKPKPFSTTVTMVKEDMRDKEAIKRFITSYKQQERNAQIKALKPHRAGCDPLTCQREQCYVWEPDTIVKKQKRRMRKRV